MLPRSYSQSRLPSHASHFRIYALTFNFILTLTLMSPASHSLRQPGALLPSQYLVSSSQKHINARIITSFVLGLVFCDTLLCCLSFRCSLPLSFFFSFSFLYLAPPVLFFLDTKK